MGKKFPSHAQKNNKIALQSPRGKLFSTYIHLGKIKFQHIKESNFDLQHIFFSIVYSGKEREVSSVLKSKARDKHQAWL